MFTGRWFATLVAVLCLVASLFAPIGRAQAAESCALYPIALPASALSGATPGVTVIDVFRGVQPGQFGWLTWAGSPSVPTLVASLTPPGNSSTYVNPDNSADSQLNVGDWARGKSGVSNSKNVRDALDVLKSIDITVPVWNATRGQGDQAAYQVSAFARIRILSYQLPQENRISARFLGFATCDAINLPPVVSAGPDLNVVLPASATLTGSVTDDGLPAGGTLSQMWSVVSGPGSVTFGSANSASTTATFGTEGTYVLRLTASDSLLTASDETVVVVNRANRPPVAFSQSLTNDEDIVLSIVLQSSDPDGDSITNSVVDLPQHGTLTGIPPFLSYTPSPDYYGSDSFTFRANDGQLDSALATITITNRPVNDPPTVDSQTLTTLEDTAVPVLLSGADVEGSPLTYTVVTPPAHGTLAGLGTSFTYTPETNFHGTDTFTYVADDGALTSLVATVTITVTSVDDAPIVSAGPDQLINLPLNSTTLAGFVDDAEFIEGQTVTTNWTQISGPGTATFSDSHSITSVVTFSQSGTYVLQLTADDGFYIAMDQVVIVVNEPPVVNAGSSLTNTLPASLTLQGAASDDGLPTNGVLTVSWSKASGPGTVVFADPAATNTVATFSDSGIYVLRLTASDTAAASTNEVTVLINRAPIVDAGSDQLVTNLVVALTGTVSDDDLPPGVAAAPLWIKVSGPGTVTFDSPASPVTSATFSQPGIYVLRLSSDDSLASTSDEVTIYINAAPVVSAGPNQTIFINGQVQLQGTVTDDGLPLATPLDIHWSVVSGPGVMAITDPTLPTTTAAFSMPGTYVLRLTASDSMLTSSSEVTITVRPINHPPEVFAGTNQLILFPATAELVGIVTDDGEPQGGGLAFAWSKVTGPGSVAFANATSTMTTATFSQSGVYILALVATDSELSATNFVTIVANAAPVVDAGVDQITTVSNLITLTGTIGEDGLPAATTNIAWIKVSGPGQALFTQPASAVTDVRFTVAGNYLLRLSATDTHAVGTDDVVVTVRVAGENMPPFVTAGTNQYVALTNRTVLQGIASDDGLPDGSALSVVWSVVSGPGTVAFDAANNPASSAIFSAAGEYVLRLTVSDTEFTVSDEVAISVYPGNQPPAVNAGADQSIVTGPATLGGTISDDGLPTGGGLSSSWSKVSGPGSITFGNSNSLVTTVSFSESGVYVFRLTGTDSEYSRFDEVTITVTGNQPPIVDAGADQVLDLVTASGAAFSTVTYPPNPDAWRTEPSQPGLTGVWGNIGSATRVERHSLAWSGSALYVGGGFQFANGVEVRNLARWDGCSYTALYDPRPRNPSNPSSTPIGYISSGSSVFPVAAIGQEVFVSGGFLGTDLNNDGHSDFLARWSGTGWEAWQPRMINSFVTRDVMLATSNAVYFGGQFRFQPGSNSISTTALLPGVPISFNVAKWDGTNWVALGEGIRGINSGTNWSDANTAWVHTLAVAPNDDVFAGGRFVMETPSGFATNLARWNGTNWSPVGITLTGCGGFACSPEIFALTIAPNGDLIVGGNFTQAGPLAVNYVARWDGTNWFALGAGASFQNVKALAYRGNDLYMGGDFTQVGSLTVNRFARWNGTNWFSISNGMNAGVSALAVTPNGIYAGGEFSTAGNQTANRIAKWGGRELPTLNGPSPITVANSPAIGTLVPVTVSVSHPCGSAMTLTWNVDGGAAELVSSVPAISNTSPQSISFTNLYTPGVHTLVATLDDGVSGPVIFSTTVSVLTPAMTTLAGMITDDGLPSNTLIGTWDLFSGPASVAFSQPSTTNAQPVTDASFTVVGTYVLRLTGSDTELSATDTLTINVRAAGNTNLPPTVNAGPDQFIAIDESAALNGVALDDGLPTNSLTIAWSQVSGPGTTTFAPAANIATVSATFSAPGTYVLRLSVSDTDLASFDEVTVTVSGITNTPPLVNADADQTIGLADSAALSGTITDDGLPFGVINSAWSQQSGPGVAIFRVQNGITYAQFSDVGTYVLRLNANDGRLNGFDDVAITVLSNTPGPVVQLLSPLDSAIITAPTVVTGTVSSAILQSWTLQYRLKPSEDEELNNPQSPALNWTTLATATTEVTAAPLATFDPTLRLNGLYELQLTATDQVGRTVSTDPVTLVVDRNMKVGHFTLSFNDLTIPVAGIPIQVTRTYDSRDKRVGDFGIGWTLDLKNIRLQKNRHLGLNWEQTSSGGLFPNYFLSSRRDRVVTITFPDGRTHKFKTKASPETQFGVPITGPRVVYEPQANTRGSLVSLAEDLDLVLVAGSIPGLVDLFEYNGNPYSPSLFQYTSDEGETFVLHERDGLRSMIDRNGNSLTVSTNGITWTNTVTGGASLGVAFQRDNQGRITNILDVAGNSMTYRYDTNGNLVTFMDRVNLTNTFTYDNRHQLLTITDPRGIQAVRNEFDADGRLIAQVDAAGNTNLFNHDLNARREILTDRLGNITTHWYDENGNVLQTQDALGHLIRMAYDANDNLTEQVDALGNTNRFTFDARDNKLTETDPLGFTTRYTYDAFNRPTSITDKRGNVTTNAFDSRGNLTAMTDALGHTTAFSYNGAGNVLEQTDALGHRTEIAYNQFGRMTNTVIRDTQLGVLTTMSYAFDANGNQTNMTARRTVNGVPETLVTTMVYDTENRLVLTIHPDGSTNATIYNAIDKPAIEIDPLGRQTQHFYDDRGNRFQTIHADGTVEQWSYDQENRLVAMTDKANRVSGYFHDALGRRFATVFPDGAATTNYFDALGRVIATTDERNNPTWFGYDERGMRTSVTNALLEVTRFTYDENGNQVAMIDALGRTNRYELDGLNRRVAMVFPDGTRSTTAFDAVGRRVAQTDQSTNTTAFTYDARGLLLAVTNALGHVTRYEYDEQGRQVTQTDALNRATRYEYDRLGRRTVRRLPLNQVETYAYDSVGNMTARTDFNGRITGYSYDSLNRLTQKTPDAAFTAPPVTFSYNQLGLRTNMTDSSGVTAFRYDNRNRLVEKATPQGTLLYAYDAHGSVTNISSTTPDGVRLSYSHDALNRLSTVVDPNAGTTSYGYDSVGNLGGVLLPNDVLNLYAYDSLNRLTNLTARRFLNTLANYAYTVNPSGHRATATETLIRNPLNPVPYTINRLYHYDATYRLTNETITLPTQGTPASLGYVYDAVGNRLDQLSTLNEIPSTSYSYDANDRLASDTYDNNGNTLTAPGFGMAQPDRYEFENRLIERTVAGKTVTITYDGDGNRVRKTVSTATNTVSTLYLVDTVNPTGYAQVLEESVSLNSQPTTLNRVYAFGLTLLSQDQPLNGVWTVRYHGMDGHGSTRYLTDALGDITDTYDYDAFGNVVSATGFTPNNFLFTSEQFDPDLGLYSLRARYHDITTGRFWTMDEFAGLQDDPLSLHKYLYVSCDPVNRIDPSGNMTLTETQVTVGIVGLTVYALYSATPHGQNFNRQIGRLIALAIVTLVNAVTIEITADELAVFSSNKHTEEVVGGLLGQALVHAAKLENYGSGGGGPQDPRNGWKNEVKAALQRAKELVEKRLKNSKAKAAEYLKQIKEIAEKTGVTLE